MRYKCAQNKLQFQRRSALVPVTGQVSEPLPKGDSLYVPNTPGSCFYRYVRHRFLPGSRDGKEVWSTWLKGTDFVTLLLDGDVLLAATRGEVFCLDAATGKHLWSNGMPGQGFGLASIATARGASNPATEQQRQNDAAAARSTTSR